MDFLNRLKFDIVDASGNIIPNSFWGLLALTILFFMLTVYFFTQNRKNKLELETLKYLEKHKNEILEALKKVKIDITYTTWEIIVVEIKTIINLYREESSKNDRFKAENEKLQSQIKDLKECVKKLESLNSYKGNNNEAKKISELLNIIKDKDKLIENKDQQLKQLPDLKIRLEISQLLQDKQLETIENQKQEISRIEETIKNQKQEISSLEETIENQKQDIDRLEETIENQNQEISSLEETIMNPIQEISSLEETIMNPIQEISSLEETIMNHKKKIISLQKTINIQNEKINTLKKDYTYYNRLYKKTWNYIRENKRLCQEVKYLRKLLKRRIMVKPIKEEIIERIKVDERCFNL